MNNDLRPLERRVQQLRHAGVSYDEIAWRFRRTPGFIRRVSELSEIERPTVNAGSPPVLRPVERVVRASSKRGLSTAEIAARFRRSPDWVRQVERNTEFKLARP